MVESFVEMFNQLKTIHCMCPKCDNIMRASDLKLISKDKTDKTWLDTLDSKTKTIENKEDKFAEEESKIREESRKKGREQVPKLINQSLNKNFLKLKYDPYDVKAILHPIDFVAFDGMNEGQVNNVTLLSNKTENPHLQSIHGEIAKAIKNKAYDWKVLHVAEDGEVTYK
ncbi:Endonuclease archaeal Holliday junction resolvase protein [Marine Group I thaumarchaeote SCGC AAA799-E16]|uniref:Holliday junction resolvase-like protein n=2 Tax=Marine Group I TaxID=905826 RepID=A0A087S184_9ARCH|nr:Endonuclease archaeal Holliday junction resolvase protein [Marine Group I thaumarchaeote SCGC AAA799-E16]KFM19488.1 Holliday junction resolvase-like protein [Marine Group I thaumarchaeote SCGC RSA3]